MKLSEIENVRWYKVEKNCLPTFINDQNDFVQYVEEHYAFGSTEEDAFDKLVKLIESNRDPNNPDPIWITYRAESIDESFQQDDAGAKWWYGIFGFCHLPNYHPIRSSPVRKDKT